MRHAHLAESDLPRAQEDGRGRCLLPFTTRFGAEGKATCAAVFDANERQRATKTIKPVLLLEPMPNQMHFYNHRRKRASVRSSGCRCRALRSVARRPFAQRQSGRVSRACAPFDRNASRGTIQDPISGLQRGLQNAWSQSPLRGRTARSTVLTFGRDPCRHSQARIAALGKWSTVKNNNLHPKDFRRTVMRSLFLKDAGFRSEQFGLGAWSCERLSRISVSPVRYDVASTEWPRSGGSLESSAK
jgi:hypothetical protein